jgi:hypothetical protein
MQEPYVPVEEIEDSDIKVNEVAANTLTSGSEWTVNTENIKDILTGASIHYNSNLFHGNFTHRIKASDSSTLVIWCAYNKFLDKSCRCTYWLSCKIIDVNSAKIKRFNGIHTCSSTMLSKLSKNEYSLVTKST